MFYFAWFAHALHAGCKEKEYRRREKEWDTEGKIWNTIPHSFSFRSILTPFSFLLFPVQLACNARYAGLPRKVSPFGNPRIIGCYAPPRGVSPLRRVLHRLF